MSKEMAISRSSPECMGVRSTVSDDLSALKGHAMRRPGRDLSASPDAQHIGIEQR